MPKIRRVKPPEVKPSEIYRLPQRQVSLVEIAGDHATMINLRDGHYGRDLEPDVRWVTQTVDLAELTNVHFILEGGWGAIRGVAHAMLCFEFADSQNVVLSIEALILADTKYAISAGLRRTYQLRNVWASERDALVSRAYGSGRVHCTMFNLHLTQRQGVEIFKAAAARTTELIESPEWYHAATNSCSTNIANMADVALPGQRARSLRYLLPGYLPNLFVRKGLIRLSADQQGRDTASLIAEFDALPRARELNGRVDFSARLHGRTQNYVDRAEASGAAQTLSATS